MGGRGTMFRDTITPGKIGKSGGIMGVGGSRGGGTTGGT